MGIKPVWQNSVLTALKDRNIDVVYVECKTYDLLCCNQNVVINLVSLNNNYHAEQLIDLQNDYKCKGIYLVQLWEDIWYTRKEQVLGRIRSMLGLNERLHARKAKIVVVDQKQADDFLNQNHIQASARAKFKFALIIDEQIIAVACFSNTRLMKRISPDYRSVELIRFATLMGFTITGGFSKLIKHFIKLVQPNDMMSYADRDWSLGNAYEQSGFKLAAVTSPADIWLNKNDLIRHFSHRLPLNPTSLNEDYLKVFNTGNLKYILYL